MTKEEAIKILEDERYVIWESASEKTFAMTRNEAFDMAIKALEVDLVRCGECKYQNKGENEREAWNLCAYRPWLYKPTSDNYFCGHGERRSDE